MFENACYYGAAAARWVPLSFIIIAVEALDRRFIIKRGIMGATLLNLSSEGVSVNYIV